MIVVLSNSVLTRFLLKFTQLSLDWLERLRIGLKSDSILPTFFCFFLCLLGETRLTNLV